LGYEDVCQLNVAVMHKFGGAGF